MCRCPCGCGQLLSGKPCMCGGPMAQDGHCVGDRLLAQEHRLSGGLGEDGRPAEFRPSPGPMPEWRRAALLVACVQAGIAASCDFESNIDWDPLTCRICGNHRLQHPITNGAPPAEAR